MAAIRRRVRAAKKAPRAFGWRPGAALVNWRSRRMGRGSACVRSGAGLSEISASAVAWPACSCLPARCGRSMRSSLPAACAADATIT